MNQISKLREKIRLVSLEGELIQLIRQHNSKVDEFTRKFDNEDLGILEEVAKIDLFDNKASSELPADYYDELRGASGLNLKLERSIRESQTV